LHGLSAAIGAERRSAIVIGRRLRHHFRPLVSFWLSLEASCQSPIYYYVHDKDICPIAEAIIESDNWDALKESKLIIGIKLESEFKLQ
jgi:hypothetical protein